LFQQFCSRLRTLFNRGKRDAELDEEIQFHLTINRLAYPRSTQDPEPPRLLEMCVERGRLLYLHLPHDRETDTVHSVGSRRSITTEQVPVG